MNQFEGDEVPNPAGTFKLGAKIANPRYKRNWSPLPSQQVPGRFLADSLEEPGEKIADGDTFLLHRFAVTDRDGVL